MARKALPHQTGPTEAIKIESMPIREPGKGEVRIRVKGIGLNRSEVNLRTGAYGSGKYWQHRLLLGRATSSRPKANDRTRQTPRVVLEEVEPHESGHCSWRSIP
jgi:threonine dehydrogenase-like Zn-dependent dehydrogenase